MKQLAFDFSLAVEPTLDNFVAGGNAELVQHLRGVVHSRARERFLYLWGPPASGRTHLLKATLAGLVARGVRAAYVACEAGTTFSQSMCDAPAVAVDDVERLGDAGQRSLFNLHNGLRASGATLLVTGPAPPSRLALRADLATRLAWGLVYEVHAIGDAEKAQALARHAAQKGLTLAPDVCDYLLTHVRRDMPALLGVVDALDRFSLETKRSVTVPLVRELLTRRGQSQ